MADGYAQAAGDTGVRQPARRVGDGQRDGRADQLGVLAHPAGDHRRAAGAVHHRPGGDARQRRRGDAPEAPGQVEQRAGLRRGRPPHAQPGDPHRHPAREGPGVRLDPLRRLGEGRAGRRPSTWSSARWSLPGRCRAAQLAELVEALDAARNPVLVLGPEVDAERRERRRGRPGRQAPGAGVDRPVGLAVPVPDPPPRVPRRPARRRAGPHRRAGRSRPHPGDRCSGLPLPPVRPGPLPPGRSPAGPDHQRPRRGRPRADGHRRRGRHPRGRSPGSPPPSRTPIAPRCRPCRTSRSP